MDSNEKISPESLNRVKKHLGEKLEIGKAFWLLRDDLNARGWTAEYIKDLRGVKPAPDFLSLVEKFEIAKCAFKKAITNTNTEKAKIYKALAYKTYANCYLEAGMSDESKEMIKKYEKEKEGFIIG